jgi:hypothetical protein
LTAVVFAVRVVQPLRSIYAQPHIKVSICQERAPFFIEQDAIGLKIVPATPPLGEAAFLQFHGTPVEIKSG